MKEYDEIFKVAGKTACKYYNNHKTYFKADSLDLEDVKQEVNIIVLKILEKYPSKSTEEKFKLCNQAIKWRLMNMTRDAKKHYDKFKVFFNEDSEEETQEEVLDYQSENELVLKLNQKNNFKFEELSCILTEKNYQIMYEIVINKRTFDSVSEMFSITKHGVIDTYRRCLRRIQLYFNIDKDLNM